MRPVNARATYHEMKIVGPRGDAFGRLAEALHVAFFVRENMGHSVVAAYRDELPAVLLGLVRSRSYIAILPDNEREELLAQVARLCREHPDLQGRDTFMMPYKTHAVRSFAT